MGKPGDTTPRWSLDPPDAPAPAMAVAPRWSLEPPAPVASETGAPARWSLEPPPQVAPATGAPAPAANAFGTRRRSWLREKLGATGAAIVALLAKLKAVLLFLPKIKLLVTASTALVSVAAYSLIWGWSFALGFVLLIFVHEMGHVIALRREGIPASAPMFIPFMGAVIGARSLGDNALAEARVGLAGPLLGSLAAGGVALAGVASHSDFLEALGYTGMLLNLFNLLPVVPLDGGRAMAAMTPWMWFLGLGALVVLDLTASNPVLLIITIIAVYELYRRWQQRRSPSAAQTAYYRVSARNRVLVGAVYVGLIVVLALGMHAVYLHRVIP
jgi:Zn-dependent protease